MAKIDLLRKIIREEIKAAIREEFPKIIKEIKNSTNGTNNIVKEMRKSQIPLTLNTVDTYERKPDFKYTNSTYLNSILQETAQSMQQEDDYSILSEDVNPISFFQPKEASVGDINTMLATARASSDISMVQINEVPDYSGLMKNLMDKGAI